VAAGAATNLYLPSLTALQNGAYAAIISADRQIAAIARTDWGSTGAAAIYSNVQPGTDVILPLAAKAYNGQVSLVSIQNTDTGQQANVTVELYKAGAAGALNTTPLTIGPGTSQTLDLGKHTAYASVPAGTVGYMKVKSNVPVGVQSFIDLENSPKAVYAFEGVPAEQAAAKLYVPLVRAAFAGYTTGISVVNPGTTAVQVTVTYYGSPLSFAAACRNATFVHNNGPVTVDAGSSKVFYQQNLDIPALGTGRSGLPDGCLGSAVIESTGGNIVAIINDANLTAGTSAAFNAVSEAQGARKVSAPLYRNKHTGDELSTGIQAMNIGTGPAQVTLEIKSSAGPVLSANCPECTQTIAQNASYTWYPPTMPSQNANVNVYGSATLTSNQPLAVIVNDATTKPTKDAAIYNGLKADQ